MHSSPGSPGLTGTFGAAIAAGRLLRLNEKQLVNALGIGGSYSGGLIEFSRFLTPPVVADHRKGSGNALGYLRVMFAVATSTRRLAGFASTAHNSWARSSDIRTHTGSATSAVLKGS